MATTVCFLCNLVTNKVVHTYTLSYTHTSRVIDLLVTLCSFIQWSSVYIYKYTCTCQGSKLQPDNGQNPVIIWTWPIIARVKATIHQATFRQFIAYNHCRQWIAWKLPGVWWPLVRHFVRGELASCSSSIALVRALARVLVAQKNLRKYSRSVDKWICKNVDLVS